MYYNAALVLEGGAMRGCYTSGVLDHFLIATFNLTASSAFQRDLLPEQTMFPNNTEEHLKSIPNTATIATIFLSNIF